jgi:Holliday junction resolvase RusA-like endonuclease
VIIHFTIPGQPQGKGRPRVAMRGARPSLYTPAKTANYEGLIAHAASQALAGRPPFDGPVSCMVHLDCQVPASWSKRKQAQALAGEVFPTTKPDADNVVKAIFDGCNAVLWRDDVQVIDLVVRKRYSETPRVRVEAWPVVADCAQQELA